MIDAARRWKARATAGCALAPAQKPQAGPHSSPAPHDRADTPDEARRSASDRRKGPWPFAKMGKRQRVGFETLLSLLQLSARRRQTMRQMVAERGGRPNSCREVAGGSSTMMVKESVSIRDERRMDEAPPRIVLRTGVQACRGIRSWSWEDV